jgi:hypothetical protein
VRFAEKGINRVEDIEASAKDFLQLWRDGPFSGVKGTGDLVDIVAKPADLAEILAERLVVDGRAALGAVSRVAEGGGAHEGADSKAGLIRLGGDGGEFLV